MSRKILMTYPRKPKNWEKKTNKQTLEKSVATNNQQEFVVQMSQTFRSLWIFHLRRTNERTKRKFIDFSLFNFSRAMFQCIDPKWNKLFLPSLRHPRLWILAHHATRAEHPNRNFPFLPCVSSWRSPNTGKKSDNTG